MMSTTGGRLPHSMTTPNASPAEGCRYLVMSVSLGEDEPEILGLEPPRCVHLGENIEGFSPCVAGGRSLPAPH